MSEYEYDREFWGEIDKATLKGLKRCATVMFYTMIGVVITLLLQPVRLYQYLRYRWHFREEAIIERESKKRFENLKATGHI